MYEGWHDCLLLRVRGLARPSARVCTRSGTDCLPRVYEGWHDRLALTVCPLRVRGLALTDCLLRVRGLALTICPCSPGSQASTLDCTLHHGPFVILVFELHH